MTDPREHPPSDLDDRVVDLDDPDDPDPPIDEDVALPEGELPDDDRPED